MNAKRWATAVVLFGALTASACAAGEPLAGTTAPSTSSSTTSTGSTTTSSAPSTTASGQDSAKQMFIQLMRELGYAKNSVEEIMVTTQAESYCEHLGAGLTRQQLLDTAAKSGPSWQARAEAVLAGALVHFCPEHSTAATR